MQKKYYKERNEELWDVFSQLSDDYNRALIRIGELQAENEILKSILKKHHIEIPQRHMDY
jgi:NADH:ubiquinone oxidoreductase subunit D